MGSDYSVAGLWQVVADFRKKLPRWNPSIYAGLRVAMTLLE